MLGTGSLVRPSLRLLSGLLLLLLVSTAASAYTTDD